MTGALREAEGTAARIAETMGQNLNGALLSTASRLQELILALGEAGAADALIVALEGLQDLLTLLAENADVLSIAFTTLAVGAVTQLAVGMGTRVVVAVQATRAQLAALNAIAGTSTTVLRGTTVAVRGLIASLGPFTLAIAAASVAYVALAQNASRAEVSFGRFDRTLAKLKSTNEDIARDQAQLTKLNEELSEAIEQTGRSADAAKALEAKAISERIANNQKLAATYRTLLEAQQAAGEVELERIRGDQQRLTGLGRDGIGINGVFRFGQNETEEEFRQRRQEAFNALVEEANRAQAEGRNLSEQQVQALQLAVSEQEKLLQVEQARAQIAELSADPSRPTQSESGIVSVDEGGGSGGTTRFTDDDLARAVERARELTRTEIEQIQLVRDAEIERLNAAKIGEEERGRLIAAVNRQAAAEIAELPAPR